MFTTDSEWGTPDKVTGTPTVLTFHWGNHTYDDSSLDISLALEEANGPMFAYCAIPLKGCGKVAIAISLLEEFSFVKVPITYRQSVPMHTLFIEEGDRACNLWTARCWSYQIIMSQYPDTCS